MMKDALLKAGLISDADVDRVTQEEAAAEMDARDRRIKKMEMDDRISSALNAFNDHMHIRGEVRQAMEKPQKLGLKRKLELEELEALAEIIRRDETQNAALRVWAIWLNENRTPVQVA